MSKPRKSLQIALLLSVLVHALTIGIAMVSPSISARDLAKKDQPVEVELMDAEKMLEKMKQLEKKQVAPSTKGQIVEQDQRLNDETPEDARFLSKHNQKVIKETQAKDHGKFKNTDDTSGEKQAKKEAGKVESPQDEVVEKETEQAKSPDEPAKEFLTSDNGPSIKGKPSLKDLTPSFKPAPPPVDSENVAVGGGEGPSATDDHLKNVQTGMQTLLSTREFVYYAYYNRIKDKLRQYWEPKIKEKMERIVRQGRVIASTSDRITRIVIVLNSKGTLVRVQVIGASGVQDLDDAAVEAFRAAAPFPNPPKGIVDPDGTIKIRWDFILEA